MNRRRLELVDATVGEVTYDPGAVVGRRNHRRLELVLVHAGTVLARAERGLEAEIACGCVGLLLPGLVEELRMSDRTATRITWISGRPQPAAEAAEFQALCTPRAISSSVAYLAREALAAKLTQLTASGALIDALATALLWRFIAEAESDPARFPEPLERARWHIHAYLDEPLDLTAIAEVAGVTPAHLIRLFREHLDTTPMRYLWNRRITVGIELLTSTGLPIGQVAAQSGFKTSFHFARRIHEATGVSPTELRSRDEQPERMVQPLRTPSAAESD